MHFGSFGKREQTTACDLKEQLSWIGLEDTFNGLYSKIIDEYDCEEVNKLEEWLNEHIEEKLFAKEQQELKSNII